MNKKVNLDDDERVKSDFETLQFAYKNIFTFATLHTDTYRFFERDMTKWQAHIKLPFLACHTAFFSPTFRLYKLF